MRELRADLHIHSCLSPCAEPEMTPATLVRQARLKELDLIAVCDHNSAENADAVSRAAKGTGLAVIRGMEITTREEAHVLGLFADDGGLQSAQKVVHDSLSGKNDPEFFGEQLVVDEHDRVIRHSQRLLIGATNLALEEVVQCIHERGGIAIAAHVDRPSFSVISQLGFIPPGLALDAVEVCGEEVPALAGDLPVIRSSDAHRPEEIGSRCTRFLMEQGTLAEIALALKKAQGRRIL